MSTRRTSSKSSTIRDPPFLICACNASKCSDRMRPISRIVVLCPSEALSMLRVIPEALSMLKVIPVLSRLHMCTECKGCAVCKPMHYWRLRCEGGTIFRRSLKSRRGTVGVWVAWDAGNPPAAGEAVAVRIESHRRCANSQGRRELPPSKRGDQEVLKRCRLIRSFLIFEASVCLGMPRLAAAPVGPPMTPSASRKAVSIIALSRSTRFATSGTLVVREEQVQGALGDVSKLFPSSLGVTIDEISHQQRHIVNAFA